MRRRAVRTSESPMSSKPSATSCIEPLRLPVGGSERTVVVVGVSLSNWVVVGASEATSEVVVAPAVVVVSVTSVVVVSIVVTQ